MSFFELGLFMGRKGHDSAFVVAPGNSPKLRMLSDLGGLVRGEYDQDTANIQAATAPACGQISKRLLGKHPDPGIYIGSEFHGLGLNWRSYGKVCGLINYSSKDLSFGEGSYRFPAGGDLLNAPWRTFGLRLRRDQPSDGVRIYVVTEQADGTEKKIYFGTHHRSLHVLPEFADELRVPLPYAEFDKWSYLHIAVDSIHHSYVEGIRFAKGLRIVGPIRLRNIFLCDSAADIPNVFVEQAIRFPFASGNSG
ncbi:MAG: hypothetical protein U0R19_09060 [Bryobacteraceae bacterium]